MTESSNDNDEIDLKQLIRSVISTRYWVLISLIAFSAVYWGLQSVNGVAKPPVLTYETRLSLVFKGVDEGKYPNESPFTISDIISPVVLSGVYDKNELGAFIGLDRFISAFSARPYTPDRSVILQKYSELLSDKGLSGAELEELQERLNKELKKASSDGVTISFSGTSVAKLPEELVEKLMSDVPREWANHMIENVGVGQFNEAIYSSGVLDVSMLADMDYLIAFEMLLDRLELLQSNIDVIRELPNGLVVEDEISGLSLPDLEKAVLDVRRYRVAPLINPVRSLGIAKNPELVELYFENELIELKRSLTVLQAKKNNVANAYTNYLQSSNADMSSNGSGTPSVTTQIAPEFFDKIVELTNSGADIVYRQELNTELLEASNKISSAEAEILRITQILESMKGQNSSTQTLRESYSEQVNDQMPEIVSLLKSYFEVSQRLYAKLSIETLGSSGQLFRFYDGEIDLSRSRTILSIQNLRLYLILVFLVTILVVPIAMIRQSLKEKELEEVAP